MGSQVVGRLNMVRHRKGSVRQFDGIAIADDQTLVLQVGHQRIETWAWPLNMVRHREGSVRQCDGIAIADDQTLVLQVGQNRIETGIATGTTASVVVVGHGCEKKKLQK